MNATLKKHLPISFASFLSLLLLTTVVGCTTITTTRQKASVVVVNKTGEAIHSLMLIHKYSNVYSNNFSIETNIVNGATSKTNVVTYNTGLFTTGQDWWQLSWVTWNGTDTNGAEKYATTPNNFRGVIDEAELLALKKFGNGTNNPTIETMVSNVVSDLQGPNPIVALAKDFFKPLVSAVLNSESTKGFKKHVLRLSDADNIMYITIYKEGQNFPYGKEFEGAKGPLWYYGLPLKGKNVVVFKSKSGYSVTVYSKVND